MGGFRVLHQIPAAPTPTEQHHCLRLYLCAGAITSEIGLILLDLEVINIEQQFYYNTGRRKTSEVMELNYQSDENGKMAYVYIGRTLACALAL